MHSLGSSKFIVFNTRIALCCYVSHVQTRLNEESFEPVVLEYQKQKLPAAAMFFAKSSIFSIPETKVAHSLHVFANSRQNEESL